jgi:hypothetical protein
MKDSEIQKLVDYWYELQENTVNLNNYIERHRIHRGIKIE